jgi:XTP/dITP diphosphohydrolase
MDIVLASGNRHKKKELEKIFSSHTLILPSELGISFDCDETGKTFMENALLKAETLYALAGKTVLADDSGLCVEAMDGAPGIYSARYGSEEGGPKLSDSDRNALLLSRLKDEKNRRAVFVCCMALILDPFRIFTVQESFPGTIGLTPFGGGGFGYDPVFIDSASGKTVAELPEEEKNRISHRGRAGKRMNAILEDLNES